MESIGYSWELASIGLIVCIVLLLISKPFVTYKNPQNNNVAKGVGLFFLLYILNSIFSFWEWDTYHSWWGFVEANLLLKFEITAYEPIYNWLATISRGHYFLWRTLIWTPACLLLYFSAKRLNMLNRNLMVAMILFLVFLYSTRNLLGIAMLLLGLVMFMDDNSHSKLFGLLLVAISYFFHKTMYITIIFAIMGLFHQSKKSIILLLLFFPFFSIATTYLINNIISGEWVISLGELGDEGNRVVNYASTERGEWTIFGILQKIITYVPQYLALIYVTKRIVFDKILEGEKQQRVWTFLMQFSFVCIYVASTFYFTETSFWIFERFKYMGMIPLTFVLAKVWSLEPKTNGWVKSLILLQILSLSYRWFIQWYHWT